jgi:hypothetical protein
MYSEKFNFSELMYDDRCIFIRDAAGLKFKKLASTAISGLIAVVPCMIHSEITRHDSNCFGVIQALLAQAQY